MYCIILFLFVCLTHKILHPTPGASKCFCKTTKQRLAMNKLSQIQYYSKPSALFYHKAKTATTFAVSLS